MSWKTDALMVGGLAVGGYLVYANIDKITAWLAEAMGKNIVKPALEALGNIAAVPGTITDLWIYDSKLQLQKAQRNTQIGFLEDAYAAEARGDMASAEKAYRASTEARINALQISPGGLSDIGLAAVRAQEKETLMRIWGVAL